MEPTISVGDIVLYTNLGDADGKYPPEQQAALVTRVRGSDPKGMNVCLHIFYTTGQFDMDNVPYSREFARGHWSFK